MNPHVPLHESLEDEEPPDPHPDKQHASIHSPTRNAVPTHHNGHRTNEYHRIICGMWVHRSVWKERLEQDASHALIPTHSTSRDTETSSTRIPGAQRNIKPNITVPQTAPIHDQVTMTTESNTCIDEIRDAQPVLENISAKKPPPVNTNRGASPANQHSDPPTEPDPPPQQPRMPHRDKKVKSSCKEPRVITLTFNKLDSSDGINEGKILRCGSLRCRVRVCEGEQVESYLWPRKQWPLIVEIPYMPHGDSQVDITLSILHGDSPEPLEGDTHILTVNLRGTSQTVEWHTKSMHHFSIQHNVKAGIVKGKLFDMLVSDLDHCDCRLFIVPQKENRMRYLGTIVTQMQDSGFTGWCEIVTKTSTLEADLKEELGNVDCLQCKVKVVEDTNLKMLLKQYEERCTSFKGDDDSVAQTPLIIFMEDFLAFIDEQCRCCVVRGVDTRKAMSTLRQNAKIAIICQQREWDNFEWVTTLLGSWKKVAPSIREI